MDEHRVKRAFVAVLLVAFLRVLVRKAFCLCAAQDQMTKGIDSLNTNV